MVNGDNCPNFFLMTSVNAQNLGSLMMVNSIKKFLKSQGFRKFAPLSSSRKLLVWQRDDGDERSNSYDWNPLPCTERLIVNEGGRCVGKSRYCFFASWKSNVKEIEQ